jgi:hypothetical protein
MIIPIRIIKNADISIDDNGKAVKLNSWITCWTSGRNKDKIPRTISAVPLNYMGNKKNKDWSTINMYV